MKKEEGISALFSLFQLRGAAWLDRCGDAGPE
jgi:hypothetical protein